MEKSVFKIIGLREDKILLEGKTECRIVGRNRLHKSAKVGDIVQHVEHGFYDILKIVNPRLLDDNFRVICETKNRIVGHVYETAYLIERRTNEEIELGDFYGDPTCALISPTEDWCLIGGEKLILWIQERIFPIEISDIYDMRQVDKNVVEVLTDPWSDKSGIWRIDIATKKVDFVREFNDYRDKEYSENIDW